MSKRITDEEMEADYVLTSWGAESPVEVERTKVMRRFYNLPHFDAPNS